MQLYHIDGLVQERRNSIANALEVHLSCTNPSICTMQIYHHAWDFQQEPIWPTSVKTKAVPHQVIQVPSIFCGIRSSWSCLEERIHRAGRHLMEVENSCELGLSIILYLRALMYVTPVKQRNLTKNKTDVACLGLQFLTRLQNWIYPKTGQYKACIASNTKCAASKWAA